MSRARSADNPAKSGASKQGYSAQDIEVLEGLEPVRRRPGMYIGGTDERAMHHLAAEVIDNAMDEAIAGYADWIEVSLNGDGALSVGDNGRGIPIDPHPKFKDKSALEVVLTTLHAGGKFGGDAYKTAGGLHGVGISVVNALSERLHVEVARDKQLWVQDYARGKPLGKLEKQKSPGNRRGTSVTFLPDPDIFGAQQCFKPAILYRLARSKAYLSRGIEIRWACDPSLLPEGSDVPKAETLCFPGGLADFLATALEGENSLTDRPFTGQADLNSQGGRAEWAIAWPAARDGKFTSYCNTVPTPLGGTHEAGLRNALTKSLKAHGDLTGNRRASIITADDVSGASWGLLSVFIPDPEFQGQTKERLATASATRLVESAIKDRFDHWLSEDPKAAAALLEHVADRAEERVRRRKEKELSRKSATRKLRLPGKLADCSLGTADGTELFLVEGDSAGGSAKQARNRKTQAILPLRGKILNVASASTDRLRANQEIADIIQALGCGSGASYDGSKLRYERVIIMTDADVDGAHIASLLMTFFFREMPGLIEEGHLFLAVPPLYRLSRGGDTVYAMDDAHRVKLMDTRFKGAGKVEISRFKGLGEMPPSQLKETTMAPASRSLVRVTLPTGDDGSGRKAETETARLVDRLMGRKPEHRLAFIQENADRAGPLDI